MSLVEKLAAEGHLTPEQVERIGENVRNFMDELDRNPALKKEAMEKLSWRSAVKNLPEEAGLFRRAGAYAQDMAPLFLGSAALTAAGTAASKLSREGVNALSNSINKSRSYQKMLEEHPQLADADPNQTEKVFNTLYTFNPHYAKDPLVAGTFVKNVMDQERLDIGSVGNLVSSRKALESGGGRSDAEFFRGLLPSPDDAFNVDLKADQADRQSEEHRWKGDQAKRQSESHDWSRDQAKRQATEHGWRVEDRPLERDKLVQQSSKAREEALLAALQRRMKRI